MGQPTGLSSWMALRARVANLVGARRRGVPGPVKEALWRKFQELVQKVQPLPRILVDTRAESDLLQGLAELGPSSELLPQRLRELTKVLTAIENAIFKFSRERFKDWIANSLKSGARALHKYTKQYGVPRQQLAQVYNDMGVLVVDALQVVEVKAAYWGGLWRAEPPTSHCPPVA